MELSDHLLATEIELAEQIWIKTNQRDFVNSNRDIDKNLRQLNVSRDEHGIMRCVGRLSEAPLPYDTRTPILLNNRHRLSQLIVTDIHQRLKHITVKQTLT